MLKSDSNLSPFIDLKKNWLSILQQEKAIAVIRSPQPTVGLAMAEAVARGGIKLIEITWNSRSPQDLVKELRIRLPNCIIGAGTIINSTQLKEAISAGAQFLFSPYFNPTLIEIAVSQYNIPFVPGVLSPTEIVNAWQAGASAVKVFPIQALGGASYIKNLVAPLDSIPLIPTGGVTVDNAGEMLKAGAIAVGLSSSLFPKELIFNRNWREIVERTTNFVVSVKKQ